MSAPRRTGALRLLSKSMRSAMGASSMMALVVLVASILVAAVPAAVGALFTRQLQEGVAALSPNERYVTATSFDLPVAGGPSQPNSDLPDAVAAVWGRFEQELAGVRQEADEPLRSALGAARFRVISDDYQLPRITGVAGPDRALVFAVDPRIDEEVQLIAGRAPRAPEEDSPTLEVMLSRQSAEALGVEPGEVISTISPTFSVLSVVVSGIYAEADPAAAYWQLNRSTVTPAISDDGNSPPRVTATVYVDPATYEQLPFLWDTGSSTSIWLPVRTGALDNAQAAELRQALAGFLSRSHYVESAPESLVVGAEPVQIALSFESELLTALELVAAQNAAMLAVLAVVAAGPLGVVALILWLCARLVVTRRQRTLSLVKARGGSLRQVAAGLGIEGLVLGLPTAALGYAIARFAVDGSAGTVGGAGVVLVGLLPAALLIATGIGVRGRTSRQDVGVRDSSRIRWVAEIVVVALAVVATVQILRRGAVDETVGALDPLLAAAPLLLSLAVAVVILRIYPLPMALLSRVVVRRKGVVPFIGALRATRERSGIVPIFATVIAVSLAASSVVLLSTLRSGVQRASQSAVGADVVISGPAFTTADVDQIAAVDGVSAATPVFEAGTVVVRLDGKQDQAQLYLVDAAQLATIQRGIPDALDLDAIAATGPKTPVVISGDLGDGSASSVKVGVTDVQVAQVTDVAVGIGSQSSFVIADFAAAQELYGGPITPRRIDLRLDPGTDPTAIEAQLRAAVEADVVLRYPALVEDGVLSSPLVSGLLLALLLAAALAAALTAAAVVLSLLLSAPSREGLISVLRVLGLSAGQLGWIGRWQVAPIAAAGILGGAALAAGLTTLIYRVVDLRPFTSGRQQPEVVVEVWQLATVFGGFLFVLLAASSLASLTARKRDLALALRTGQGD